MNFFPILLISINNTIIFSRYIEFHMESTINELNSYCWTFKLFTVFAIINNSKMNILKYAPLNTCSILFLGANRYAHFKELVIVLPTGSPERLHQFLFLPSLTEKICLLTFFTTLQLLYFNTGKTKTQVKWLVQF